MAGILTAASTADPPTSQPAKPATPVPSAGAQPNTLSMNNPLANITGAQPQSAAPVHNNAAINEALMNAFRPVIPDQINSLLGPAIGAIQGHTLPISYVQPRPVAPARRSS